MINPASVRQSPYKDGLRETEANQVVTQPHTIGCSIRWLICESLKNHFITITTISSLASTWVGNSVFTDDLVGNRSSAKENSSKLAMFGRAKENSTATINSRK